MTMTSIGLGPGRRDGEMTYSRLIVSRVTSPTSQEAMAIRSITVLFVRQWRVLLECRQCGDKPYCFLTDDENLLRIRRREPAS